MLRFMVLGAPRSGTAWAANWLSGLRLCLHDPLWDHHYSELDSLPHAWGVSCTGLPYFHEWVNAHPCPKVILHRPRAEIDQALASERLGPVSKLLMDGLWKCQGLHVDWGNLFDPAGAVEIHEHLRLGAINLERYEMLRRFKISENWRERVQNPEVWQRLSREMAP